MASGSVETCSSSTTEHPERLAGKGSAYNGRRPAAHRLELREHPWQRFGGDRAVGQPGPARFRCRPSPGDGLPVEVWVVVTGVFGLEGSAVTLGMRGPCASRRARRRRTAPSQPGNGSSTQTSPPKLAAACGCAPRVTVVSISNNLACLGEQRQNTVPLL